MKYLYDKFLNIFMGVVGITVILILIFGEDTVYGKISVAIGISAGLFFLIRIIYLLLAKSKTRTSPVKEKTSVKSSGNISYIIITIIWFIIIALLANPEHTYIKWLLYGTLCLLTAILIFSFLNKKSN